MLAWCGTLMGTDLSLVLRFSQLRSLERLMVSLEPSGFWTSAGSIFNIPVLLFKVVFNMKDNTIILSRTF